MVNLKYSLQTELERLFLWLKGNISSNSILISDSRKVSPGDVFLFYNRKSKNNLYIYIREAIKKGASAIILDDSLEEYADLDKNNKQVKYLLINKLSCLLGPLADMWYGNPSGKVKIIAITGTNGKSSCAHWIANSLNSCGIKCGVIGTIGAVMHDGNLIYSGLTTPDVLTLHWIISIMYKNGIEFIAIEASSIGLDQDRMDSLKIKIACFTNLTRDHLDYHGDMNSYSIAKLKLFKFDCLDKILVNIDDAFSFKILNEGRCKSFITFGLNIKSNPDILGYDIKITKKGYRFSIRIFEYHYTLNFDILGKYNIYNILLVVGVLKAIGLDNKIIIPLLGKLNNVKGRMEKVQPINSIISSSVGEVIVDYAHTPDALLNVLSYLKQLALLRKSLLICVFGCGGDRDVGKREEMTRVAVSISDKVIVTSDNPRSEDPQNIIRDMLGDSYNDCVEVIVSRSRAILYAILKSNNNDIVLISGKGHETYQDYKSFRIFFDDRQWSQLAMILSYCKSISIDSRTIKNGDLFFALKGNRFDGHDYILSAKEGGACAVVVSRPISNVDIQQIIVHDTQQALLDISFVWRRKFSLTVIAVLGSNGKTTTKEMIALILSIFLGKNLCLSTKGNMNNHIGVPLTVLKMNDSHKAAIFELGMNHSGEIKILSDIVKPSIAVITNAQREHQEFMGDVESVAYENGSVINSLESGGVVIYPGDDNYANIWSKLAKNRKLKTLCFGLDDRFDIYAKDITLGKDRITCKVVFNKNIESSLTLNISGLHNLRNALAAIAACISFGVSLSESIDYISQFRSIKGRMSFVELKDGGILVDDTYNSNPDSALAAISVLKTLPKPQILVFGDMGEVGSNGEAMHHEVGKYAYESDIDYLVVIGKYSSALARSFGNRAFIFSSIEDIINFLDNIKGKSSILIKGSRFMRMERIVNHFQKN